MPTDPKGKATKKTASKKRKYLDRETARAAAVAEAADRAERGGARSKLVVADQPVSPALRVALEEVERRHGSPARTATFVGRRVAIEEGQSVEQEPQASQQPQEGEQAEQAEETELTP